MKVFVGCSSRDNIDKIYLEDAKTLGNYLVEENYELVFGYDNHGSMGVFYNLFYKNNKVIHGMNLPIYDVKLDKTIEYICNSIPERTLKIIEKADILIFLAGGIGTYQELLTALDIKRTYHTSKPILIVNTNNFYDNILNIFKNLENEKFIDDFQKNYQVFNNIDDLIIYLKKIR